MTVKYLAAVATLLGFAHQGAHASTLEDRGYHSGIHMVYEADRNLTWIDARSGPSTWQTAQNIVSNATWGGFNDWRLPVLTGDLVFHHLQLGDPWDPQWNSEYNGLTDDNYSPRTDHSELAHLYFDELGGQPIIDTSGNFNPYYGVDYSNPMPFQHILGAEFWTGTDTQTPWSPAKDKPAPYQSSVWALDFTGRQFVLPKEAYLSTIAVRDGDVGMGDPAPVMTPIPAAVWLFGSALAGIVGIRRRTAL